MNEQCATELRMDFAYLPNRTIVPRYRDGSAMSPICPEEFEIAVLCALQNHGELLFEELVVKSVQLLGFKRGGTRLKQHVSDALSRLLSHNRIT